MRNKYSIGICFFFLCFTMILAGCTTNTEEKSPGLALIKTSNPTPKQITNEQKGASVEDIKKSVASIPEIYDVAVIKGKKESLVAYKVKHMQRFRMKKIESKVNQILEDKYGDEDFTVSSDYKVFLEAMKLSEKLKDPEFSENEAEKELNRIINLQKELT